MTTVEELVLPNGYVMSAVVGSQAMIDEVWRDEFYSRDFPLAPGMRVMDFGANQGSFSLLAAHSGATVLAYEPMRESYALLCRNVERNRLTNRIVTYNEAVAAHDGECEIFEPRSPLLAPTGNVTLNHDVLSMLVGLVAPAVSSERVSCVTLRTALDRLGTERLDLLKLDCEGAELEILKSAPREYFARVDALVMETHDAYPERTLCELVRDLGFSIRRYDKRAGPFRTGYLFAAKDRSYETRVCPVAILACPAFVRYGEALVLDGSASFAIGALDTAPRRVWTVDGIAIGEDESLRARAEVLSPGTHEVRLRVEHDADSDEQSAKVLCLSRDYFSQPDVVLDEPAFRGGKVRVKPAGRKTLKIPFQSLPAVWDAEGLQVAISLVTQGVALVGTYEFNGTAHELTVPYSQFGIDIVPRGLDVLFSLSAPDPIEFDVCWWLESHAVHADPSPGAERTLLAPLGEKKCVSQERPRTYVIPKAMLPTSWRPRGGVLSVTPAGKDSPELAGSVRVAGRETLLKDWYTEIRFSLHESEEPIEIEIDTLGTRRDLALVWWADP